MQPGGVSDGGSAELTEEKPNFDSQFPERPWTVCFYSFRGGVGRTTLAVTTALQLPHALLLDFDLEAPGVDEFERLRPTAADQKGLIEYVREYQEHEQTPELAEFIYRVGDLCVMRAGRRDAGHRKFLAQFDWDHFYRFEDGRLFFEDLRAGLLKELHRKYLIVDARTGLTEIAGVCLGHLADAVVLVFEPTTAHQQGLIDVVQGIRDREQRDGRPIPRLYVASKVPVLYERQSDPDANKVIRTIASRCEGGSEVEELPGYDDVSGEWLGDPLWPALHHIPFRERVKGQHMPDSFIVTWPAGPPSDIVTWPNEPPSDLETSYFIVAEWVRQTERAVEGLISRSKVIRNLSESLPVAMEKLKMKSLERLLKKLGRLLKSDSGFSREFAALIPPSLDKLPPKRKAAVLRLVWELKLWPPESSTGPENRPNSDGGAQSS